MNADVLVVGAGPTGLTMALELARRDVAVRLVDAAAAPTTQTRALGVQPRTLELFERVDLADAAVAGGVPVTEFQLFSENKRFLRMSLDRLETPYPFLLMLPQPDVEELLAERLTDFGVVVERPVSLTTLAQRPDVVEVELEHDGGARERSRVRWVIGCDGAHSVVRRGLGVPFLGGAFEENFAVVDARMQWSLPHDVFFSFLNRGNFVAYFPMPHDMHRVTIAYRPGRVPSGDVTAAEVQAAVDQCAPPGARVAEIMTAGRFRINQRKVARHSVERVFLAGDAAHVHSVVGGQGMNTGIQDAFNLGWKLAAVVHGRAPAGLLNSYATERSPVAHRLVRGTRRATRMTLLRNPVATAARRHIAPHVTSRPGVQRTLARALTQLDVSYRDGTGGTRDRRLRVGDRYPDIGRLHPWKHTLLVSGAEPPGLRDHLEGWTDVVDIRQAPDVRMRSRSAGAGTGLTLLRPDGYIAVLDGGTREVSGYLEKTFGEGAKT